MVSILNIVFGTFDANLLKYFHELSIQYGFILTPIAKVLDVIGDLPFLLLGWISFVLFFVKRDKSCGMMIGGSIIIGAVFTTLIIKPLIYRVRPYFSDVTMYNDWWRAFNLKADWDTSFPSGHMCAAMAGVTGLFIWSKKKGLALIAYLYPIIIGMSRIYLCVHYPSDVIFGGIIGLISAIVCVPFVKLFYYFFIKYPKFPLSRFVLTGSFKKRT